MSSDGSMEELDCMPMSASPEWQDVQPLEVDDGRKVRGVRSEVRLWIEARVRVWYDSYRMKGGKQRA
eukprot:1158509-Pelagomonas_calceolata.AAC.6